MGRGRIGKPPKADDPLCIALPREVEVRVEDVGWPLLAWEMQGRHLTLRLVGSATTLENLLLDSLNGLRGVKLAHLEAQTERGRDH